MSRYGDPSYSEILMAARAAIAALKSRGLESCLVGGVACQLYGNSRTPNDVDLVVLDTTHSQESLKSILISSDPSFYTVPSKNPMATYRVLWFRLSSTRSCKVDLLQPGIMNIPFLPTDRIIWIDDLPVMPLSIVLLLKLQAWADHRVALRSYLIVKQYTDVADIERLLPIAHRDGVKPRSESWVLPSFITAAEARVREYVTANSSSRILWKQLGFEVPPPPEPPKLVHVKVDKARYSWLDAIFESRR